MDFRGGKRGWWEKTALRQAQGPLFDWPLDATLRVQGPPFDPFDRLRDRRGG